MTMSSSPPIDNGTTSAAPSDVHPLLATPNGDVDILSSDVVADHLQVTPHSDITNFSIGDRLDDDDDDDDDDSDDASSSSDVVAEPGTLDVGYGNGDGDDDDDEENDGDGTPAAGSTSSAVEEASFSLAARTNAIMSSYKDYIAEMQNEPIEGDPLVAEADLEMQENGANGTLVAPHRPYTYTADSSDTANASNLNNPQDVGLPNDNSDASSVGMGTVGREKTSLFGLATGKGRGDDDASFEDFYGELSFHPSRNYLWPMLRRKKFQRYCCAGILGIVIVAVIAGVTAQGKGPIDANSIFASEETGEGDGKWSGGGTPTDVGIWGSGGGTLTNAESDNFVKDRPIDSLDPHNFSEVNNEQQTYMEAYDKYLPEWFSRKSGWTGQTYKQAIDYCASAGDGVNGNPMTLCPYDAVCPLGSRSAPSGGYRDGAGGALVQWAPMMGARPNLWVSVGSNDSCVAYDTTVDGGGGPAWGLTVEDRERITQYIICCATQDGESVPTTGGSNGSPLSDADESAYNMATLKYQPTEYTRDEGWNGQTYLEAVAFCQNIDSQTMCPYSAICPLGSNAQPFGGYKPGDTKTSSAWIPIVDAGNDWVQASGDSGNACVKYSSMEDNLPDWGITGEDNEEITRSVFCCEDDISLQATAAKDPLPTEGRPNPNPEYETIGQTYKPQWFGRSSGWTGATYLHALAFCAAEKSMMLCPYKAICPHGRDTRPYGGHKTADDGELEIWTPIQDTLNGWVQIGPDDSCMLYSTMYGKPPDWGLTGLTDRDVTPHIICCELNAEDQTGGVMQQNSDGGSVQLNTAPTTLHPQDTAVLAHVKEKYNPIVYDRYTGWMGRTYDAASEFCSSTSRDGSSLMLCPFEAVCPEGPMYKPYGGFADSPAKSNPDGDSWVPLSNSHNSWVQVGPSSPCVFYNMLHDDHPDWGLSGRDSEEITRRVFCCDQHEGMGVAETPAEPLEDGAMGALIDQLQPQWFHRPDWSGTSYPESLDFCVQQSLMLCPFKAICPQGPGNSLFSDYMDETTGSWAPITDTPNDWVKVSSDDPCVRYSVVHSNLPEWGMTAGGQEDVTRHIACCASDADEPGMSIAPSQTESDDAVQDGIKHTPHWYDQESGWIGATYNDAVEFCARNDSHIVCPADAICPQPGTQVPVGGVHDHDDEPDGAWAPVFDAFNEWIRVSSDNGCMLYSNMHGDAPIWGLHGEREKLTRHIACCDGEHPAVADVLRDDTMSPPLSEAITQSQRPVDQISPGMANSAFLPEAMIYALYDMTWYARDDGWDGTSYGAAVEYCSTRNGALCPREAYCPDGHSIVGGMIDNSGWTSWAPVSDGIDFWVSVSRQEPCELRSNKNSNLPKWDGTKVGTDVEIVTRHMMCCNPMDDADATGNAEEDVGVHDEMGPHLNPTTEGTTTIMTTTEATVATVATTTMATTTTTMTATIEATVATVATTIEATTPAPVDSILVSQMHQQIKEKYFATWYNRSDGWKGQTYTESLIFCAKKGTAVPCPYEAYCPMGPGKHVVGGMRTEETYAPMIDIPNGWVSVGPSNTCLPHNALNPPPEWGLTGMGSEEFTQHILCCREPENGLGIPILDEKPLLDPGFDLSVERSRAEMAVMDFYHPIWYERRHGYHGGSHADAELFCANIGGKRLCPVEAYCPGGISADEGDDVLFLDRPPFEGEQWAPVSSSGNGDHWVMVGTVEGSPRSTCATYENLEGISTWEASDSQSIHKRNVLCCADEVQLDQGGTIEEIMKSKMMPVWFDEIDGWEGGSWDDAGAFCEGHGGRERCNYPTYCPYGNGKPVMGAHRHDFNAEGEQWAPVGEVPNTWIMIGQKYQNSATTCMTFESLEGSSPGNWNGMAASKRHIMCCMPEE